jgi:antitoxin component of RelBE/YafQ-DinJ toxin-antitoxin module
MGQGRWSTVRQEAERTVAWRLGLEIQIAIRLLRAKVGSVEGLGFEARCDRLADAVLELLEGSSEIETKIRGLAAEREELTEARAATEATLARRWKWRAA